MKRKSNAQRGAYEQCGHEKERRYWAKRQLEGTPSACVFLFLFVRLSVCLCVCLFVSLLLCAYKAGKQSFYSKQFTYIKHLSLWPSSSIWRVCECVWVCVAFSHVVCAIQGHMSGRAVQCDITCLICKNWISSTLPAKGGSQLKVLRLLPVIQI